MKRIVNQYVRPYYGLMLVGFIIKFFGTITELAIPWALSHIIDEVIPTGNIAAIFGWGAFMLAMSACAWIGNIVANRRASGISRDVTRTIRHDLFDKIQHLSSRQIDETTIPSLVSRLTTDTYNINNTLGRIQRLGVRAPILLMGGVTITLIIDWRLSLVLIATLPILFVGVMTITLKGIPLHKSVQEGVDQMVRTVRDDITGIRVIRALSKGDYENAHFAADNEHLSRQNIHANAVMSGTGPLMNVMLNGGQTICIVVGAYLVNGGLSEPGRIIAFLSYFTTILNATLSINRMFVMLSRATASCQRVDEVLSMPSETIETDLAPLPNAAHVVFDDVVFSYNGRHADLDHIAFSVPRGSMLGVIGATGCGKTTLIQLLQRFYRVDSGAIYINGVNLNTIPDRELHEKFGVAFQSDSFFAGTVRENICLGRDISEEAIDLACRCAQASEFIDSHPERYDYEIQSKGANLSGGQRQRLLIARALAGNPEILVLDDSSSALDYRTDAAMRNAVREHYPNTTLFLIAQRVSSVRNADQILVLDNGVTAGLGTHDELMRSCEVYSQISRIQTGGEEGGTANAPA